MIYLLAYLLTDYFFFEKVKTRPRPKEPSAGTKGKNKAKAAGRGAGKVGSTSKNGLLGWLQRKPT